jgi:thiamine biosynthesis lipoprotein
MLSVIHNAASRTLGLATRFTTRPLGGAWHVHEEAIMGTAIRVELWSDEHAAGESAAAAVMREMHRIDHAMSPHKPNSELSRINRLAAKQAVALSDEMLRLLLRAGEFSELSGGAFDITYAGVGHLYDYRAGIAPGDDELARSCSAIGWNHVEVNVQDKTVRFTHPGTRIDLGGFAKGHAVDNATGLLLACGVRNAIVSAGGDSRVIGDRCGRPWTIGIADPRRRGEVVAVLPLEDVAISTSGDYERYFERGGERFHHVIDPRTGRSASRVRSVTILAADGLTTEALSKSVFVLGVREGLALVERLPGVDAVVIDEFGALHSSSGFIDNPSSTRSEP